MAIKFSSLVIISLLFVTVSRAQSSPASAEAVLKEAYDQAAKEGKNVFVLFHASWCGWCHKLDTAMNDPRCKNFFTDNYVIRHLVVYESKGKENLENPGSVDLLTKYKGNDVGVPYWMVFDKNGNLLADSRLRPDGGNLGDGDNVGCPASEAEVDYFTKVLKQTSKLDAQQLQIIWKRFRENEH